MHKKLFKNIDLLTLIILLFVFITNNSLSALSYGGTLNIRELKKPLTLNPIHAVDDLSKKITEQIFENLVIINNKGEIEPYLAESWKIKDEGRTILVNLREDIYFHEEIKNNINTKNGGRNVTAEDWKWSLNYLASPENKSTYSDILKNVVGYNDYINGKSNTIKGINVIDKYSLEFKLQTSNALFLYNLAHPAAVVIPKEDVQNKNLNWDLNPVGTGAFIFYKLEKNSLTLVRNNDYWDYEDEKQLPYLEKINLYFTTVLERNDYILKDYSLFKINSEEYNEFIEGKNIPNDYNLIKFPGADIYYYGLYFSRDNYQDQQIDNPEFRELLNHIIDRKKLIENLNSAYYMPIKTNQDIFANNKDNETEITELKDKYDFNSALKLKLLINNKDINIKAAEEIKKQFSKYEIELELIKVNWVNYINEIEGNIGEYDLFFMSYKTNNVFEFLRKNFYSESGNQKDNYFNYHNPRLNYLLDYLEIETAADKRARALEIIKDIIYSDVPAFYIMQSADTYLVDNRLNYSEKFSRYNNQFYKYLYFDN
jgi:ABC-type transport system substrate-binding protein